MINEEEKLNPAEINTSKYFHLQKDTDPKLFKSEKTGRGPLSGYVAQIIWIGLIFGAIIGGCLPLVLGLVLALLGFGCAGISATAVCCGGPSIAAGIMSATGNIASGSIFACN